MATSSETAALGLKLIDIHDERIGKPNKLCAKITGKPGLATDNHGVRIVPAQFFHEEEFATVTVKSDDMIRLLKRDLLAVVCESDTKSIELPEICQRVPTADRRRGIRAGWGDVQRTPQYKHETVEMAVFGAKVESDGGVHIGPNTLVVLTDCAGRISAALDEINENGGKLLKERGLLWQLNIDLSGNFSRQLMSFLTHNRDAKRIAMGTTTAVENALLTAMEMNGDLTAPASFREKLAATYVIRRLYKDFDIHRSLTELFPWRYEGRTAKNEDFQGRGRASNIGTAIVSIKDVLEKCGIKPKDLPEILDFAFRCWYKGSPTAVYDAHRTATETSYRGRFRLHSTLAIKMIMLVSIRAYMMAGRNEKAFLACCEQILHKHWNHHKDNEYSNPKAKKMTMDRFWQECRWFNDMSRFNSGAQNTVVLLKQLTVACNDVCGPLAPRKQQAS